MTKNNMTVKNSKLIAKAKLMILKAIEEENINYIKNILIDLTSLGILLDNDEIIFISSETRSILSGYIFLLENYLEDEEAIRNLKSDSFKFTLKLIEYLEKNALDTNDNLKLLEIYREGRINIEKVIHNYSARGVPKSKLKIPSDLMEAED